MRNWKASTALFLSLALVAAGCSGSDTAETTRTTQAATTTAATTTTVATTTTTSEATTTTTLPPVDPLIVWIDEAMLPVVEGVGADFQADTGVPVTIEAVDFDDIRDLVLSAPGDGPDVFAGAHAWLGELTAAGVLAEIDIPFPTDYFPVALAAFTIGGNVYGLPYAVEGMAMLRNTDLVPEAPATYGDLVSSCEALAGAIEHCLGIPAGDAYANQAVVHAFDGYVFGYTETGFDTNDVGLDGDGALAAAEFLDAQVKAGIFDPAVGQPESIDLFTRGVAPFLWTDLEQVPLVEAAGIPFAASAFPPIEDKTPVPFIEVDGFMVNAFSGQPVVAQVFVSEFLNSEAAMFDLTAVGRRGPALRSAFELAVADDPTVQAFAPVDADPAFLLPDIPRFGEVSQAVATALSVIYEQDFTSVESARAAFQQAADAIRSLVDES